MSSMEAVNLLTSRFKSSCQTAEAVRLVLTSFTLDVIPPSQQGLDSVQRFFSRCTQEHLGIVCSDFNPSLSDAITSLPEYVEWSTLKHLVLSRDSIDKWIRLWPTAIDTYLRSLHICGTASTTQTLSHQGVMFVCQPTLTSPLEALIFENVVLEDWVLIVTSIDVRKLGGNLLQCDGSSNQLESCSNPARILL